MAEKTAIVVEDASNWAKQHQLSLGELDFKTSVAKDYADAVSLLCRERFDVAVVDLCLTTQADVDNLNGIFLLEHLQSKNTPVIIVTGRISPKLVDDIFRKFEVFAILDKLTFSKKKFKEYVLKATEDGFGQAREAKRRHHLSSEQIERLVHELLARMPVRPNVVEIERPSTQHAPAVKPRRVFISHSSKDNSLAGRLASDLRAAGIEVWYDNEQIRVGDTILEKMDQGLSSCDYMIIILSPDSVGSVMVRQELLIFLNEELVRGKRVMLPVLFRDCEIPLLLRSRRFADFRGEYIEGFRELQSALGIA